MPNRERQLARFGLYEVDLQRRILTKSGLRIRLQDQPFQVLTLLLERPGEILTRDEIRQKLWTVDTYVEFDDGLNTAIRKLRAAVGDTADSPRFIETIPRRGYRFVAPVSFVSPAETVDAAKLKDPVADSPAFVASTSLSHTQVSAGVSARASDEASARPSPLRGRLRVAAVVLLVAGAILLYRTPLGRLGSTGSAAPPDPALHPRLSVVVLGFNNLSRRQEQAWLSPALAEMLATELSAGEQIRTIPGENVARTKRDLALPDSDSYANDTLLRIRQNLGADFVVIGSYFDLGKVSGGTVRLDLRMQDARTGELVASVSKTGTEADLPALASMAGADLRRRLGAAALSRAQEASLSAAQPSNSEAAQLYSEGLARLRAFDNLSGQALLEKSLLVDANFAPAHAALADAFSALGYDAKARDEAEKAFDLSNSLSREDRMRVEARYREATREWDQVIEIYRSLFHLFPDNIEYGLRLADAQNSASKSTDALKTVALLRKLAGPSSGDPRIDIVEAQGAESMGNYAQEDAMSGRAAEKAQALGAGLLAAAGLHLQCWALNRLGKMEQALAACATAQQVYARTGDRDSVARVMITSGSVLEEQGQFAPAQARYEEALAIHRATGDQKGVALALNVLAVLNVDSGNYASARTKYEQSTSIARKNGDQDAVINGLGNLANLSLLEGDLPGARRIYDELIVTCRRLNSQSRTALQLGNLGSLLYLQGDLPAAQKVLEESVALDLETGDKRQLSDALSSLGELFQSEGKLVESRQKKTEALQLQVAVDNKVEAADVRLGLAESSIEEGHPAEAVDPLQHAIAELKELKSEDEEAEGYPILARAFLLLSKPEEAQRTMESGASVNAKSRNRMVQLSYAIVEGQVRAANGQAAPAIENLTRIIAETKKSGFYGYHLEARLALAEVELQSGKAASAHAHLKTLEQEARERGFLLIAKKAATLFVRRPAGGHTTTT
jgi:DNA-binding winged helix-turn-helix (wHTH) protein/tetratricopeptide (TPR) repeat protein